MCVSVCIYCTDQDVWVSVCLCSGSVFVLIVCVYVYCVGQAMCDQCVYFVSALTVCLLQAIGVNICKHRDCILQAIFGGFYFVSASMTQGRKCKSVRVDSQTCVCLFITHPEV